MGRDNEVQKKGSYTLHVRSLARVLLLLATYKNPLWVSVGSISNPSYRTLSWLCLFVQVKSPPS